MSRKGIVLAGGAGTRLHPLTLAVSKQLLPIYDKPMIYYPIATLMRAGVRRLLIITTPDDRGRFEALLGDGRAYGVQFEYAVQPRPEGIAQAFLVGRGFIGGDPVALILGDNVFFGDGLGGRLRAAAAREYGATIFGSVVGDPQHYGVVELDAAGRAVSLEEKPARPRSSCAVTGLYFYDADVVSIAESLTPSARGELEITDVNAAYLRRGTLITELLDGGITWLDVGTPEALLRAGTAVETLEVRRGRKAGCIEETAYRMGYIDRDQLVRLAEPLAQNAYGRYLLRVAGDAA